MTPVNLDGPLLTWSDTALAARLEAEAGARPLLAFLGPESLDPKRANAPPSRAESWIEFEAPGVLPLVGVVQVGARFAWLYPRIEALGVARLTGDASPPIRIAAEIVAGVAEALHQLGARGLTHPGPAPEDIGIDSKGKVHLTGFASPWPASPVLRDPSHGDPVESTVWRLGILLAQLLGGAVHTVSDEAALDAMTRRVAIRATSRPGPLFSERYRDWLRGMLSWESKQRPPLSAVASGLRAVAAELDGEHLAAWAAAEIPKRCAALDERSHNLSYQPWQDDSVDEPARQSDPARSERGAVPQATSTLPGVAMEQLAALADVTMEAHVDPRRFRMTSGQPTPEPGTIPVKVGPPVEEAVKPPPKIPRDFLDPPTAAPPSQPGPVGFRLVLFLLMGVGLALLFVLGLLVLTGP